MFRETGFGRTFTVLDYACTVFGHASTVSGHAFFWLRSRPSFTKQGLAAYDPAPPEMADIAVSHGGTEWKTISLRLRDFV